MIGNNDDSSCGPPGKGYDNQQIPSGDGVQQERAEDAPNHHANRQAYPTAATTTTASSTEEGPQQKKTKFDMNTSSSIDMITDNNTLAEFSIPETEEDYKNEYINCLRKCDQGLFGVSNQAHQVPRNNWNKMKRIAVDQTLQKLSSIQRTNNNNMNDQYYSSDESVPPGNSGQRGPSTGLTSGEKKFITAFQHCLPLNAGFHCLRKSKICYCPCGPNLEPWRKKHNIFGVDRKCTQASFEPNALMDHLKKEGGVFEETEKGRNVTRPLCDIFHYAARVYLEFLYADWHGKGKNSILLLLGGLSMFPLFLSKNLHVYTTRLPS